MKRDMELVRKILVAIEENNEPRGGVELNFPEHDPAFISYHVMLLTQAKLITAVNSSNRRAHTWIPTSLTWSGHEFLDAARNETVWNKAMTSLKEKSMTVPFEVLKAVVMQKCREYFGVE